MKWAVDQIASWKNDTLHPNTIHVHGTNDHIFPIRNVTFNFKVAGGGHFMTVNKADEITGILRQVLSEY